jgi:hypothetical protein
LIGNFADTFNIYIPRCPYILITDPRDPDWCLWGQWGQQFGEKRFIFYIYILSFFFYIYFFLKSLTPLTPMTPSFVFVNSCVFFSLFLRKKKKKQAKTHS